MNNVKDETLFIDPAVNMKPSPFTHDPLKALVVPRPIGWISSINAAGVVNLAPFSYFNLVSGDPPCVIYCPNGEHLDGGAKDSLLNVQETGEFVCILATYALREQMVLTSKHVPRNVDEMTLVGLTPVPSVKVKPPRVGESPAALECVFRQTIELPTGRRPERSYIVMGEIVGIHVNKEIVVEGKVDVHRMRPVARLGYDEYAVIDDVFTMSRPD
ncbi:MAG: flavin reductase family protein [Rhodospirillales bacterium]|nr:flavin reductase family protein [Rhodospirillales bacterium]